MVVDASFVVDVLVRPDAPPLPVTLMRAPHLIDLEVANALRGHVRRGSLRAGEASSALGVLGELPIERFPHLSLLDAIWALRGSFTAYDASYVALAQAFAEPLLTADARLARAARRYVDVELA